MTPFSYPYDESGVAATNLVSNEEHVTTYLNADSYYMLVPTFGPFFTNNFNLQYMDSIDGRPLVLGKDYEFVLPWKELSESLQQMIYAAVLILDTTLTGRIQMTYQTIGGVYCFNAKALLKFMAEKVYNPREIEFSQIINLPALFPPSKHLQDINTIYGIDSLASEIEILAGLIKSGQANSEIAKHIQNTANPHKDTVAMMALDQVVNKPTATDAEVAAMQPVDHYLLASQALTIKEKLKQGTTVQGTTLDIPPFAYEQQTIQIQITNFDSWKPYTITVSSGTFSLDQTTGIITYTGPAFTGPNAINVSAAASGSPYSNESYGMVKFTVNETTFYLKVYKWMPDTPTVTVHRINQSLQASGSAFNVTQGMDTQKSASWELAYDAAFTRLVGSSENDAVNLSSWMLPSNLTIGFNYYLRLKYTGTLTGDSNWSDTFSFIMPDLSMDHLPIVDLQFIQDNNGNEKSYLSISRDGQTFIRYQDTSGPTGLIRLWQYDATSSIFKELNIAAANPNIPQGPSGTDAIITAGDLSGDGSIIVVDNTTYTRDPVTLGYHPGICILKKGTDGTYTVFQQIATDPSMESTLKNVIQVSADGKTFLFNLAVFTLQNGQYALSQMLPMPTLTGDYYFGENNRMSADATVIAVPYFDPMGKNAMYIYRGTPTAGYSQTEIIVPRDPNFSYQQWGRRFALSGDGKTIAIGDLTAIGNDTYGFLDVPSPFSGGDGSSGLVEVFSYKGNNWVFEKALIPRDLGNNLEMYALTVSLTETGNTLFVGSTAYDGPAFQQPNIYVYIREQDLDGSTVWKRVQQTYPTQYTNEYGYTLDDHQVVVSDHGEFLLFTTNTPDYGSTLLASTGTYVRKPLTTDPVLSAADAPLDYTWNT